MNRPCDEPDKDVPSSLAHSGLSRQVELPPYDRVSRACWLQPTPP